MPSLKEQPRRKAPIVVVGLVVIAAVFALFMWRRKVSPAQCDELLDHYAELVVKERRPDAGPDDVAKEKQRERDEAKASDEFKSCTSEVLASEHACAMKAQTSDALIKCLE